MAAQDVIANTVLRYHAGEITLEQMQRSIAQWRDRDRRPLPAAVPPAR